MGKAFGYSSPKANIGARIRRLAVGLALPVRSSRRDAAGGASSCR